ncbi:ABC transporter ATP-binding protein [Leptospira idonii]|uniref:ABC transporter ATP-binding protein n=1 Tax=Leptospira idonii TaxID=1193500 RepID=UPI00143842BF|nr:ABC transporter ATP-binding protein [Leptospira idonii]
MAVSDLNFKLKPGRLTALLGPNGAGKTTTMRLLAGFLDPSSGRVEVEGLILSENRQKLQQKIGYLPENGPAYRDLTVEESLFFFGRSRGLDESISTKSIHRLLGELDLGEVRNTVIGNLSKGFKQRVALAGVLLGDPDYLVLDEPSYGLDPIQMTQIRSLIKELGKSKTVLISTHSLDEVEEICEHVIILSQGQIVADSPVQSLRKKDKLFIEARIAFPEFKKILESSGLSNLKLSQTLQDDFFEYELELGERKSEEVFAILSSGGIVVREMRKSEESLKAIFNSIAGN